MKGTSTLKRSAQRGPGRCKGRAEQLANGIVIKKGKKIYHKVTL